jgi:RNA polymerase sigma factor for flagellar operon FliA
LRSSDWVSRSVRTRARRLRDANDVLTAQLGRQPTSDELAAHLGTTADEIETLRADLARGALVNLSPAADDSSTPKTRIVNDPESVILDREQRAYLRDAVAQLPERHRLVVIGYYLEERPMAELARFLGVTESRISQIRSEALLMLRDGINSQLDPESVPAGTSNRVMRRRAGYYAAIANRSSFHARVSDRTVIVPPAVAG